MFATQLGIIANYVKRIKQIINKSALLFILGTSVASARDGLTCYVRELNEGIYDHVTCT